MIKNILRRLIDGFRNISIKNKLLLFFYIQIIIPIIFIGYSSYNKSSEVIKDKSLNYSRDIMRMIELRFEDLSSNVDSLSLQILYDNRIYEYLKNINLDKDSSLYFTDSKNILRDAVISRNEIESICLVSLDKQFIYYDSNNAKHYIKNIMPYEYVLEEAEKSGGKTTWVLSENDGKVENIYAARIIYDRDTFKPIGLLAMLIKKDFIESIYKDLSPESVNNISILSKNGSVILSKNKYDDKTINSKKDTLVSYVNLKNPNWKIVYHVPFNKLYEDINTLKYKIIIITIWAIIVLSITSTLLSMDIVKPINQLVAAMKNFQDKGIHKELEVKRNDELGYLGRSFNKMSEKIDYLLNMIYKEKLTRKEAEIKALQAQINPHFLFNTLENINWLAQLNGVQEISDTVTALGSLMEASIGRDQKLVCLREEIKYMDNYFEIMKSRFGDRIVLVKEIEEGTEEVMIPKLLVQPLLENAIYHGVEKLRRNGIITIRTSLNKNIVNIEVEDNGVGIKEEDLLELREYLNGNAKESEHTSVGLSNVNKRLKLYYGEENGLKIYSKYKEYTKVIMGIPLDFKSNEV